MAAFSICATLDFAGTESVDSPNSIPCGSSRTMRQEASELASLAIANPSVPAEFKTGSWNTSQACELETVAVPVGVPALPILANTTCATTGWTQSSVA